MTSIRAYAKESGVQIIGKLTRHPEWEYDEQWDGSKKHSGVKSYSDEGGNVFHIGDKGVCIITIDDSII